MTRQPRVDDSQGFGKYEARLVMIRDDQVQSALAHGDRFLDAADAAVDRHQQLRLLRGQRANRLVVQPVAFVEAVGDVIVDIGAEQLQALAQ